MSDTSGSQEWKTLHSVCSEWEALICSVVPEIANVSTAQREEPPQLLLHNLIPEIRSDLHRFDLKPEQVEGCGQIFEQSLLSTSCDMQAVFQDAWSQIPDSEEVRSESQSALVKLHEQRFKAEIVWRRGRLLELAAAAKSSPSAMKCEDMAAEWTEETRALMERVYQQHPKLEAHEKKLLAEASGLSLRQISIWVSPILHFH